MRCQGFTRAGRRCRNTCTEENDRCRLHCEPCGDTVIEQNLGIDIDWLPTRDQILGRIGDFRESKCIELPSAKYGVPVYMAVTETLRDLYKLHKCPILGPVSLANMVPGVPYNFIVFITNNLRPRVDLVIFPRTAEEVATKHKCFVNELPPDARLVGSGEIAQSSENTREYMYNASSSLWFYHIYPYVLARAKAQHAQVDVDDANFKVRWETETLGYSLRQLLPNAVFTNPETWQTNVKDPLPMVKLVPHEASCARVFKTQEECFLASTRPSGVDCDKDGMALADFLRGGMDPDLVPHFVPEPLFAQRLDIGATIQLFKENNIPIPRGAITRRKLQDAYKELGNALPPLPFVRVQVWPEA